VIVAGVDLAGPSNASDTAVAMFTTNDSQLTCTKTLVGADDQRLLEIISAVSNNGPIIVGLDAPLSYNSGGGDRPGDKELRRRVMEAGLESGSVMTPTMNRMAYLTLRGVCVARALDTIQPVRPRVVEVHPGASLALRGAPIGDVRSFKRESEARRRLVGWLEAQGLQNLAAVNDAADHLVAACACALAAWKWASGDTVWCRRAVLPLHPYDFAC
jgi:predicted nuclease with RNAse H fold